MRNKVIFTTIGICIIVGVIIFFFQRFHKIMENKLAEQVANSQELLAATGGAQIQQIFQTTKNAINSITNSFALENLLLAIEENNGEQIELWTKALENLFINKTIGHRFLFQIRYIDAAGMEIVRVDRKKNKVFPVKVLQDKSEEFYFSETMKLSSNRYYLSPITLNREFGKIEIPHREVIRLAKPIYHEHKQRGIVIINIEMEAIYELLDDLSFHAWLYDASGKFIYCSLDLPEEDHAKVIRTIPKGRVLINHLPLDYYHESGERSVVAFSSVNIIDKKWLVVTELPFEEIITIMTESNRIRAILLGSIFISFIGVLIYFYKMYTDQQKAELKAEMAEDLLLLNKQLEEKSKELETANYSLEEIDKRKTDFLNMVAHDLRTPLTSIRSYSDLLLRYGERSDKDRSGYAEIIKKESVRLSKLIDDFLDISKIEAGLVDYNEEYLDINELIDHFIVLFQGEGETHNITITSDVEGNLPHIKGDKQRLGQVFSNLLSNAIKFTPQKGSIAIRASSITIKENGGEEPYIQISVIDTGVGIPPDDLAKIFDKFVQVNRRDIKSTRGSGLGLTISKDIIEQHGGTIQVESKEGHGTNFTFTLKASSTKAAVKN